MQRDRPFDIIRLLHLDEITVNWASADSGRSEGILPIRW